MRYFEVVEPYYALLKAVDKDQAKSEYNNSVADLDDIKDIYEVPEDYALVRFSQAPGEDKELVDPKDILADFKNDELCILIFDGALL